MASTAIALPRRTAALSLNNVPAHIAARMAQRKAEGREVTRLGGGGGQQINRISLKGNRFNQIVDGETIAVSNATQLEVVVLGTQPAVGRQYYEGAYDPNAEATAPVCFSHDGIRPAAASPKKQCGSCAECPMNMKGSSTAGNSKAKACSYVQRLAVMVPGDETESVYALDVKAMSLFGEDSKKDGYFNLKNYGDFLAKQGIEAWEVYTTVMFDPRSSVPKLLFTNGDWLDEGSMTYALEKQETEVPKIMKAFGEAIDTPDVAQEAPRGQPTRLQAAIEQQAATQVAPPAPARPAPRQAAPVQQAPVQQAPVQQRAKLGSGAKPATARPAPVQQAPVQEAEVVDDPLDAAVQAAHVAPRPRLGGGRPAPAPQATARPALGGGARAVKPLSTPTDMQAIDDGLSELSA